MLYIFQSTHKLPIWQVEKIGIHLGKVMKKKTHKGKQELFTFINSVAFNISIYIHILSIYVQTAIGSERSLFQTQLKNTKTP